MSMLTPPGLSGKKYRITGDRYPRMRRRPRHLRRATAVLAAALVVGTLSYGTVQLVDVFTGGGSGDGGGGVSAAGAGARSQGGAEECAPAGSAADVPAELPEPEAVTVNVYNATDRTGLAQDTADALESRGFRIGAVDNALAELDGSVAATGLLIGAPAAEESGALALLGAHLADAERDRERTSGGPAEGEADEAANDAAADAGDAENAEAAAGDADGAAVDLVLGDGFRELTAPRDVERELTRLTEAAAEATPLEC